jgi:hypothetical protein
MPMIMVVMVVVVVVMIKIESITTLDLRINYVKLYEERSYLQ